MNRPKETSPVSAMHDGYRARVATRRLNGCGHLRLPLAPGRTHSATLRAAMIGLFLCVPTIVSAQQEEPTVGVVVLDEGGDRGIETEVADNLERASFEVIVGPELVARLDRARVPDPDSAVSGQFSGMTTAIASGVERFFYKGNEAAIDAISPVFDLGMAHPEVLARRPDYADQIFSAGIVLVRAYDDLEQTEKRDAVTRLLARKFPTKQPSATTVPPNVIKLLQAERTKLMAAGTKITLDPTRAEGCTLFINGVKAEPGTPYAVDAATDYLVRLDCGGALSPVWKTRVDRGTETLVPVPEGDPLDEVMVQSDFRARKRVEAQLAAVSYWAQVDTVVGVSRQAATAEQALLVVRMDGNDRTQWSDGLTEESVQRAIAKVFPELGTAGDVDAVASGEPVRRGSIGPALLFIGAGAALDAAGVVLLVTANQRSRMLGCSNPDPDESLDCDGVDPLMLDAAAYQRDLDAIRLRRTLAWPMIAVGTVSIGYGIFRMLRRSPKPAVAIALTPRSIAVRVAF